MAPTKMDAMSILLNPWFDLHRHDEDATSEDIVEATQPAGTEQEPTDAETTTTDTDTDQSDALGEPGKRALDAVRAQRNKARKDAADARRRAADLEAKVAEFEDKDKSESEKLTQRAEQALKRADEAELRVKAALARAVQAEVKAMAAGQFADPEDAGAFLSLADYANEDGEVDVESIKADLESLLERKPHLRKPAPADPESQKKPKPKPDPSQGPRKEPGPVDFRTADKATVDAELARLGVRARS